ncbi:hypothetical protein [Sphingomonas bacterium]|uniref:hypothetical protein n=1 Tax=Sphingomonas bacterium TaxID=1895847 RepID=UPI001576E700|nr:hypothetical protein [Sphingomonas bacterium]
MRAWAILAGVAAALAPPASAEPPRVPSWDAFVDGLRDLPTRMLARLSPAEQADPQIRAEVARLALEALVSSGIDALASDGDHPAFIAQINQVLNVGQPNADTSYRSARITPGGTYRIRGRKGSLRMVRISQSAPIKPSAGSRLPNLGPQRPSFDVNALHADGKGRFDVILSTARPVGYAGDWWRLAPDTDRLLLRMVSSDWGKEAEPSFSIERLDAPANRSRPSAASIDQRLRALPATIDFIAPLFVDHVDRLRAEGYVNRLKVFDTAQLGGLLGQFYYEGAYDLPDGEALIVEAKVPARCLYRSLILANALYETTDWYNNHSSLNDSQARPDADGVLRIVVSARDPGVPNWLDTAGYPQGVIQGRWAECDTQPVPSIRKVAFADIRRLLPAATPTITPAARETLVRDRRAALQQRSLW